MSAACTSVVCVRTDDDSKTDDEQRRWQDIEAGLGALASGDHEWDQDVEAWVRQQREQDPKRVG